MPISQSHLLPFRSKQTELFADKEEIWQCLDVRNGRKYGIRRCGDVSLKSSSLEEMLSLVAGF